MLPNIELFARLFLAAFLGSLIGLERERLLWSAGLRTHMLVCVGSCLIMIVSAFGFSDILGTEHVTLDPSRVAAQVVSGIGFLGAGAILLRGDVVRGLTTAASVWTVAGIGLAVGGGLYVAAVATTVLILIILVALKPLGQKLKERAGSPHVLKLTVKHGEMSMNLLREIWKERTRFLKQLIVEPGDEVAYDQVTLIFSRVNDPIMNEMIEQLKKLPCVTELSE